MNAKKSLTKREQQDAAQQKVGRRSPKPICRVKSHKKTSPRKTNERLPAFRWARPAGVFTSLSSEENLAQNCEYCSKAAQANPRRPG